MANPGTVQAVGEGVKGGKMAIRWFMGLAIVRNTVVGRVHQAPGGISEPWQAYGMLEDWQDTNLGNFHTSKEAAMGAIVEWHEDNRLKQEQRVKILCPVHARFRPGCVMCEAVNVERKLE